MASPVAHSLVGIALTAAWWLPKGGGLRGLVHHVARHPGVWFAGILLASLPDIDYLPGILAGDLNAYHHLATHSILWLALVAGGGLLLLAGFTGTVRGRMAGWVIACLGSHLLLDMLTADGRPPYGIPLAWPVSDAAFRFPVEVFGAFQKKDWQDVWQWANLMPLGREVVVTAPLVAAVLLAKQRQPHTRGEPT